MRDPAIQLVDTFLRLCDDRRLSEAAELLDSEAKLVFPGDIVYEDLNGLVTDSKSRYLSVRKSRGDYFVGSRAVDGARMCVSTGTLSGHTLWGTEFKAIRYIDLFIIRDGLIHEQHVWNDMAEVGAVPILPQRGDRIQH